MQMGKKLKNLRQQVLKPQVQVQVPELQGQVQVL